MKKEGENLLSLLEKFGEESKVAIRNVRRDAIDHLKERGKRERKCRRISCMMLKKKFKN